MYENNLAVDSSLCLFGVLAYLVVSQRVESFPVVVDLSCDILILQNDSGHPTLTPFFKKNTAVWTEDTTVHSISFCSEVRFDLLH